MTNLEKMLGHVLRGGVVASTVALIAGLVFVAAGANVTGMRLLALGVVILIATPVARVVASTIAYAIRRDWTFTLLTAIVLGELVASIVAALT
jgi:uncharacterized membrane protein